MRAKSTCVFFIFLMLVLLAGCGGKTDSAVMDDTAVATNSADAIAAELGLDEQWPDYIPADIPPLEGSIRRVMTGSSRIRIFYEAVTERQIAQYLEELDELGFELEYMVFVQEGFPDNAEEKLARGEFDAVDITNDTYHMRLEAGGGTAVYDIDTKGFTVPEPTSPPTYSPPTAVPLQWPNVQVLPPDSCELTSVLDLGSGQFMISCQFAVENADEIYIAALQEAGFTEQDRFEDMNGNLISLTLVNGETAVTLLRSLESALTIQIKPAAP